MLDQETIIGKKYGKLICLSYIDTNKELTEQRTSNILCQCECGIRRFLPATRWNKDKSCGCSRTPIRTPPGKTGFRAKLNQYKDSAKNRQLEFLLTEDQFRWLTSRNCYYCGTSPLSVRKQWGGNGDFRYNGIDRLDSSKGYTVSNTVTACRYCNWAKGRMPEPAFLEWIQRLWSHSQTWLKPYDEKAPFKHVDGPWHKFDEPRPYSCVIGFAYDKGGFFPIMHRSATVRSAKDAWSLPSGLHEIGLTLQQQFCNELKEELNLDGILETSVDCGSYENISYADKWHWCLYIEAMQVQSLDCMINAEPDKHDVVKIVSLDEFVAMATNPTIAFTPGLREAILKHESKIRASINPRIIVAR